MRKRYLRQYLCYFWQFPVNNGPKDDRYREEEQREGHVFVGNDNASGLQISAIEPEVEGHHCQGNDRRESSHRHARSDFAFVSSDDSMSQMENKNKEKAICRLTT